MTDGFIDSGIKLICGTCAWYRKIDIPKAEQPPDFTPRGYCYYLPPAVFPVPQPKQSSLALAQGQQQGDVQILPLMMRPLVEEKDAMCGKYAPNKETRAQLEELQAQRNKEGCDPGSCGKEECNCGD
jgi:hypothetical protein